MNATPNSAALFRHVSAEKSVLYRDIMDSFAAAKRQFRLHLRPDEVAADSVWTGAAPSIEEVQAALAQLTEWGNLESQADTTRVANISDFYRARHLYRLSLGGEAVESALAVFARALKHRAELQTVALEDIANRLQTLQALAEETQADAAKVHETLRDLVRVFESLAENAQAFMAGIGRSIELQQAEATAVVAYKKRLIDYLERFIGDLIARSGPIAQHIVNLTPQIEPLLWQAAQREARDAAPGDANEQADALTAGLQRWRERWTGLTRWFLTTDDEPPQAELLRAKARSAIPQLLAAVAALNERRSGRSDRSADFRILAGWFAECRSADDAHRMARAAFALNPARHFSLSAANEEGRDDMNANIAVAANTPWALAPRLIIHPRLREYGEATPRGALPRVRERDEERALLTAQFREEHAEIEAARARLATGVPTRLSALGDLDREAFKLFLNLLGEALTLQTAPDEAVELLSGDGLLRMRLEPLDRASRAALVTPAGVFSGRDHLVTISHVAIHA